MSQKPSNDSDSSIEVSGAERPVRPTGLLRGGMAANAVATIFGQAVGAIALLVYARGLSTADFALFSVALTVSTLFVTIFSLAIDKLSIIMIGSAPPAARHQMVRSLIGLLALSSIIAGVVVSAAVRLLPIGRSDLSIFGLCVLAVMTAAEVVRLGTCEIPRVWGQYVLSIALNIGTRTTLALVVASAASIAFGFSITTILCSYAIASTLLAVSSCIVALRIASQQADSAAAVEGMVPRMRRNDAVRSALPLVGSAVARIFMNQLDLIVVAFFFDVHTVASYALATRLVNFLGGILPAASVTVLPRIVRPGVPTIEDVERDEATVRSTATIVAAPMLAACALLVLCTPLIPRVFGREFGQVGHLIDLLIIGQVVNLATGISGVYLLRARLNSLILRINLLCAVPALIAEVIGGAAHSIEAVAIASGLAVAAVQLGELFFTRKRLGLNASPYWRFARFSASRHRA